MQMKQGTKSLQYLTTFAVDLAKLISVAHERASLSKESVREMFSSAEPQQEQPLVKVALELFRNFVAFERGATRSHVLSIIKDHIWPLLDTKERSELFSNVVRQFLSRPESGFS